MRVLLVDDHPAIRMGMKALLDTADGVEVVGETEGATEAVQLAADLAPDLVVLDLRLGGEKSGIGTCREIKTLPESPRVLIHTAHDTVDDLAAGTLAGADGYLHKSARHVEFVDAVRKVYAGKKVWSLGTESMATKDRPQSTSEVALLTPKEREVYALLLKRYSNHEIARELYVGTRTVKSHVTNIMRKLGVKSRRELF